MPVFEYFPPTDTSFSRLQIWSASDEQPNTAYIEQAKSWINTAALEWLAQFAGLKLLGGDDEQGEARRRRAIDSYLERIDEADPANLPFCFIYPLILEVPGAVATHGETATAIHLYFDEGCTPDSTPLTPQHASTYSDLGESVQARIASGEINAYAPVYQPRTAEYQEVHTTLGHAPDSNSFEPVLTVLSARHPIRTTVALAAETPESKQLAKSLEASFNAGTAPASCDTPPHRGDGPAG